MALHEWIESDGNIVRFDTTTSQIQYFTPSYIPLSDPRTPTQFEIDRHTQLFPVDTTGGITTTEAVLARDNIISATAALAAVVEDPNTGREEVLAATQDVLATLDAVTDLNPSLVGGDLAHSTILLLSQIAKGLTQTGVSTDQGLSSVASSLVQYNTDIDQITTDIAVIQEQLP